MIKRVLLLQGPVGGFFRYIGNVLRRHDYEVRRIAFNGGDILFSIGSEYETARFDDGDCRSYFNTLIGSWRPDVIIMFGDERPIHRVARECASAAGIVVWSFEEGYIRPDHVTFEIGGNNANSKVRETFDPVATPERPLRAKKLTGQTFAMVTRAIVYFIAYRTTRHLFPGYRHHRERKLHDEFRFWIRSIYRRAVARQSDQKLVAEILSGLYPPFFIVALQVHDDLQLRCHGRGWRPMPFTEMVLESFKRAAPPEARLVVKAHPLDIGHGHHNKNIRQLIRKHGLQDRVEYLQSGPLLPIVRFARGLVTVNSTAGIAALRNDIPVIAFGDALYHLDGLSKRPEGPDDLDRFWNAPPLVDVERAWKFGEHTLNSVLVPGSFYLPETWPKLAHEVVRRLEGNAVAVTTPKPATEETVSATESVVRPRIGIMSPGIWRRREIVASLLGGEPVRFRRLPPANCGMIVGWGHKPTARGARRVAGRHGLPYVALEDGFLRSVRPGADEAAVGWIVDRSGIYYDSQSPSDLEAAITRRAAEAPDAHERARAALRTIRELRLSKYNHAPMLGAEALGLPRGRDVVLVIDQTRADASISGAGADGASFVRMLDAAIAENPGSTIAVKVHPETIEGAKGGYLAAVARIRGVHLIAVDVNPWALIEIARRVYVVSSQFGLEAMLAGVPVTCFGAAAYAGWGLTDDRIPPIHRRFAGVTREAFAAAVYLDYCRWIDPYRGTEIDLESAIDRLSFLRDRHRANTASVCVGFSRWKRKAVAGFLAGAGGAPQFVESDDEARAVADRTGARIVVWGRRGFLDDHRRPVVRAEDGFLRSVGLGAAFISPVSLVFDSEGIYYDQGRPSGFETLVGKTDFDERLKARAQRLRETIVSHRLSKYNETADADAIRSDRLRILVPGQVEDDASIRLGSPEVSSNLELLRRVRRRWPDAHIVYKPHPDVQAGYRVGRIADADLAGLADQVVLGGSMPDLLDRVDRVETMTSLTGFEALLRGLPVTCHGLPFYAGWGLTEDLLACPRRTRRLDLDELVAAALILYPCYVDPVTGLPCPVETIVERLSRMREADRRPLSRLRRILRHTSAWTTHNLLGPTWKLARRLRREVTRCCRFARDDKSPDPET